jgi:hypothetical protein
MRRFARYGWVLVLVAFLYPAWIFWQRRASAREAEQASERARIERDRPVVEKLTTGPVKVIMLYANPGVLAAGETANLCFGVKNATAVTIEPKIEDLKPSLSRCLAISPKRTTTYTLRAEDGKGGSDEASIEVRVR